MLQLALSRTRELDADLAAAALTGDPNGLTGNYKSSMQSIETRSGVDSVLAMRFF